jgi:hypothetical protein
VSTRIVQPGRPDVCSPHTTARTAGDDARSATSRVVTSRTVPRGRGAGCGVDRCCAAFASSRRVSGPSVAAIDVAVDQVVAVGSSRRRAPVAVRETGRGRREGRCCVRRRGRRRAPQGRNGRPPDLRLSSGRGARPPIARGSCRRRRTHRDRPASERQRSPVPRAGQGRVGRLEHGRAARGGRFDARRPGDHADRRRRNGPNARRADGARDRPARLQPRQASARHR